MFNLEVLVVRNVSSHGNGIQRSAQGGFLGFPQFSARACLCREFTHKGNANSSHLSTSKTQRDSNAISGDQAFYQ